MLYKSALGWILFLPNRANRNLTSISEPMQVLFSHHHLTRCADSVCCALLKNFLNVSPS